MRRIHAIVHTEETLHDPGWDEGHLTYRERPGDGSVVAWTSWVEGDRVFSVGCHSKNEPTVVHEAACQMVAKSLHTDSREK